MDKHKMKQLLKVTEVLMMPEFVRDGVAYALMDDKIVATYPADAEDKDYPTDIVIPDFVDRIFTNGFAGAPIESLDIQCFIPEIDDGAFRDCEKLETVSLPEGLEVIGEETFRNCSKLKTINLPYSLKIIKDSAFAGCTSLKKIVLHKGIREVAPGAFYGTQIQEVWTPQSLNINALAKAFNKAEVSTAFGDEDINPDTSPSNVRLPANIVADNGAVGGAADSNNSAYSNNEDFNSKNTPNTDEIDYYKIYPTDIDDYEYKEIYDKYEDKYCSYNECEDEDGDERYIKDDEGSGLSADKANPPNLKYAKESIQLIDSVLKIPEGIRVIEDNAFFGMKGIRSVELPKSLEKIGINAFASTGLTSLETPPSVKYIGKSAFRNCANLESVKLNEGLKLIQDHTFDSCEHLKNVHLPNGLKKINIEAFCGCWDLQEITLPSTLESVEYHAFIGTHIEAVGIPTLLDEKGYAFEDGAFDDDVEFDSAYDEYDDEYTDTDYDEDDYDEDTDYGEDGEDDSDEDGYSEANSESYGENDDNTEVTADEKATFAKGLPYVAGNTLKIPVGTKVIADNAFFGRSDIHTVELPEGLEEIGANAFASTSLEYIRTPSTLKRIGLSAFCNCSELEEVVLNEGLEVIDKEAFFTCDKLETVSLPTSLKRIGVSAFSGCWELKNITLPYGLEELGMEAFCDTMIESVEIPPLLTQNGEEFIDAFDNDVNFNYMSEKDSNSQATEQPTAHKETNKGKGMSAKKSAYFVGGTLKIPEGVRIIEANAFSEMQGIHSVDLPEGLEEIGNDAFYATDLVSVNMPSTLKRIGDSAFRACKELKKVKLNEGLETVGSGAFGGAGLETLSIPSTVKTLGSDQFSYCKKLKKT